MLDKPLKVIKKDEQKKELNISYRKENDFWCSYKALDKDFNEIVDCRFYCTKGGTVYCCIWVHGDNGWFSASAKAGGWGYDKKSAALATALDNAGVKLNASISCTGYVKEPIEAIAKYFSGKRNIHVIESYG